MQKTVLKSRWLIAIIFAIYSALGSIPHGIGLILQRGGKPESVVLNTWVTGPIAENMGGEPGMTIIPDYQISGILTIILSVALIVWVIFFLNRPKAGLILLSLAVAVLLTGGGFAPPTICFLAAFSAMLSRKPVFWLQERKRKNQRFFSAIWPWVFGISVLIGGFVFVIGVILTSLNMLNAPDVFVYGFLFLIVAISYLIITGPAYDSSEAQKSFGRQPA